MSNEPQQASGSAAKTWAGVIIGLLVMIGGTWMAVNQQPTFLYDATHKAEQMGIPIDLGKTVAVIGTFFFFLPVIRFFFLSPLAEAINNRTTELETTFTEAEDLRTEMTGMRSDYEKRLAETEAAAREQIRAEINKAQELRAQLEADARAKADDYLHKAQQEIDTEKNRVMTDIRLHVVDLTLTATEKILGESVDNDRNRRLVQEFVDQIEVPT